MRKVLLTLGAAGFLAVVVGAYHLGRADQEAGVERLTAPALYAADANTFVGLDAGTVILAASVNSALGRAGLLLMLAASVFGALAVLYGIRQNDKRLLKQGPMYALLAFGGCLVVVSHDRWFLDRIATHILAFEGDSQLFWLEGNWSDYEEDRRRRLGPVADRPHRITYRKLRRD